jgi:hypothetical protein
LTHVAFDREHVPDGYLMDELGSLTDCNESEVFEWEDDIDSEDDQPIVGTEEVG